MEFLQALFQQRLESLAQTFLRLLQQLEVTISPFTEPVLAPHKIEYLEHLILNTLKDERERYISRISNELKDLKVQANQMPCLSVQANLNKEHTTSTCSRESVYDRDFAQLHLKVPNLIEKHRKPSVKNLQQTYFQGESQAAESVPSGKRISKRKDSSSFTSLKLQSVLKSYEVEELQEEVDFGFKYLRFNAKK